MCYTECVPSAPPAAETLKDRACRRNDAVGASTFCCCFTPATTLQTVEAPAPSEEEPAGLMQADKRRRGEEERRRRELRYEPRGFVCLRLKVILPLIQQQNFTENSLAPKSFRNMLQVQVIPSLTYSPTHEQGREITNLDRVSNR